MAVDDRASEGSITPRPSTSGARPELDERTVMDEPPAPVDAAPPDLEKAPRKKQPGAWAANEVHVIPKK